jgi:hypothetical protein
MHLDVTRVVFGDNPELRLTARYFYDQVDSANEIYVWHVPRNRRAAAILWRREDGTSGSFVLLPFRGRWCVPDWMVGEFAITAEETARLHGVGYPLCSLAAAR